MYTKEQFIIDSKILHGNTYDYSHVKFKTKKDKVNIVCPEHGSFLQSVCVHLNGCGCPKCGRNKASKTNCRRISREMFISKASLIHNNFYDYSRAHWENTHKKIEIVCPKHGSFFMLPKNHMNGQGCPKCGREITSLKNTHSVNSFIEKAKLIHHESYIYDLDNYVNVHTPIKITCKIHGDFFQTPSEHLAGHGCAKCGFDKIHELYARSTEDFIKLAKERHKNKYDYSKVSYYNSTTPVEIICCKHGSFYQTPKTHMKGHGCPKCTLKAQSIVLEKLQTVFPGHFLNWEFSPDWLRGHRLDIADEPWKIAVEYDGEQHYRAIRYFGGECAFLQRCETDKYKEELCLENGFTLFRLKYDYTEEDFLEMVNNIKHIIDGYTDTTNKQ